MAAVEEDKKNIKKGKDGGTGDDIVLSRPPRRSPELFPPDFMDGLHRTVLEQRKEMRDKIDAAVPRILSLNKYEHTELTMSAFLLTSMVPSPFLDSKLERSATALFRALESAGSGIPPKQYEALVKQLWKTAKADIDESLTSPEAKRLSAPKAPPKK